MDRPLVLALAVASIPILVPLLLWLIPKLPMLPERTDHAEIDRYMNEHRLLGTRRKLAKFQQWQPVERVVDWAKEGLRLARPPSAILCDQEAVKRMDRALELETLLLERQFPKRATYGPDYADLWRRLMGDNPLGLGNPRVLVGVGA